MAKSDSAAYNLIINHVFSKRHTPGDVEFSFNRDDILEGRDLYAKHLQRLNAGDVNYHFNNRGSFPQEIQQTQPSGKKWVIFGAGRAKYKFKLVSSARIVPNPRMMPILIPDSTPEIIRAYALTDEQALLAIIRYNRLLDIFLGIATYSLQNHLRTSVTGIGQIEIDELYVGVDKRGCHYLIPVQAKGGKDETGIVQVTQDISYAADRFPDMRCKAVAVQFMPGDVVAMFHLTIEGDELMIVEERHYKLVPHTGLDKSKMTNYID
ncbi:endonuclease [Falsirhodobacter xinxiangensis]|uniref:endonuclease n=1 Tax=Falsirhodobacter xinxiangensis TaxID=2530049 RepID=UPI0010A9DF29|nr:endonuclease [Rhodobacter xinxiangensis]